MSSSLTPIIIPGRRGQKRKRQIRNAPVYLTEKGFRTRRPVGAGDAIPFLHASSGSHRRLCPLERLPTEILQMIFSHCPSVALARSSPFISRQLSTQRVFLDCATQMLSGTASSEQANAHDMATQLLSTRWMSHDMLRGVCNQLVKDATVSREEHMESAPLPASGATPPTRPEIILLNQNVRLPVKLLTGPWTDEKTQFLHFLCSWDVSIDWDNSIDGEIALTGLQEAIEERNRTVVACLLSPPRSVRPTQEMIRSAVLGNIFDRTIVFYLFDAALVYLKMNRGGADSPIMPDKLVDFHDPVLWRWATARNKTEDGAWLMRALQAAAKLSTTRSKTYSLGPGGPLSIACGREEDHIDWVKFDRDIA